MTITVKNKLNQPLLINIKGKKPLHLFPRGTAKVSETDMESSQFKNLLTRGDVRILSTKKTKEKEGKTKSGKK